MTDPESSDARSSEPDAGVHPADRREGAPAGGDPDPGTQEGGAVTGYGSDSGFTEGAEALPEEEKPA